MACVCHGRKSNLVEFQILPVDSLVRVSTSRKFKSPIGLSTMTKLVESPIGVSTSRKSNLGDLGVWPLGPKSDKCYCRSIDVNCSTKCSVGSDCCQKLIG